MRLPFSGILLSSLLFSALGSAPSAQFVRPSLRIDPFTQISAGHPTAATEGDLSAIVFRQDSSVVVSTSDGRGLVWSAPVRVDLDPTGSAKWVATDGGTPSIVLVAGVITVVWRDRRNGEDDLWTRSSSDGGQTWGTETRLDKGFAVGGAPVREYTLAATQSGTQTHIHVLFTVDPGVGGAFLPDELYLVSSRDGGQTWSSALSVSGANGTGADVDSFALDVQADDLVVVWTDDRFGSSTNDDLWLRRSLDGGVSFVSAEVQLDPSGPLNGDIENELSLSAEGNLLAIAWEEEFGSIREEAWVAISSDRGGTLVSAQRVGQYPTSSADVDDVTVAVENGVVFVGWDDDRTGSDQVRVIQSLDLGLNWSAENTLSTTGGGDLRFVTGERFLAAVWSGDPAAGSGDHARAAFTRDGGTTWSLPGDLSSNQGDVDDVRPIWNALYGNLITPWLADDPGTNGVWVGGFRPQTVRAVNWVSGAQASLDLTGFSGSGSLAWVLGSSAPGNLPLPAGDGRNLGLGLDSTLVFTLQNPALFSAVLDSDGTASTPAALLTAPPGAAYFAVGISLSLPGLTLGELTDVVPIVVR